MGSIMRVTGTEMKNDTKALIACVLMREIMKGVWVEKVTKGDFEHKLGSYQIFKPTRGHKQKIIKAVEDVVNGCKGLDRHIAYMEINSIWNGKKCIDEMKALEVHVLKASEKEFVTLQDVKASMNHYADLIDAISESEGLTKCFKLFVATYKFNKSAKKFTKVVKSIFGNSYLDVNIKTVYNLKNNVAEMTIATTNVVIKHEDLEYHV